MVSIGSYSNFKSGKNEEHWRLIDFLFFSLLLYLTKPCRHLFIEFSHISHYNNWIGLDVHSIEIPCEIRTCNLTTESCFAAAVLFLAVVGLLLSHQIGPKLVASALGGLSDHQQDDLS